MQAQQRVVVVGGGPIGTPAALYAAKRGYQVSLYDLRDDPNFGDPSLRPAIALIPLGLSERGIRANKSADVPGLLEDVLDNSRPIYTRMVHSVKEDGSHTQIPMPYGANGEAGGSQTAPDVVSIPYLEKRLQKRLLLALQKEANATIIFNHKLVSCDLEGKVASFERVLWNNESIDAVDKPAENVAGNGTTPLDNTRSTIVEFDFVMGCDGSYSVLRQCIMRQSEMDSQQSYIDALWCDFIIPPASDGPYRMDSKCLHDGSFRGGMVAPTDECRDLERHPEKFEAFFSSKFPGIIPDLLSAESATEQFQHHQKISLKSIKCGKFGYGDSGVLLGDSSHTMTRFHAMGMITGLEDVRVLFEEFIDPAHRELNGQVDTPFCPAGVVQRYTAHRRPDVHAMTDMAAERYHELRMGITSKVNRAKKTIESSLQRYASALD